ncbi:MAG: hypothetical protein IT349_16680 [Candidatus Eisenbacteria bacterium]|nr:hypothetical protein [Candidatus Eisenbacteria bacterium]
MSPERITRRLRDVFAFIVFLMLVARVAAAGPNAGGTLIVHADPNPLSTGVPDCVPQGLSDCATANLRVDGVSVHAFWVVAAFPTGSAPRLAGVTFGINYPPELTLIDAGPCADFELAEAGWPGSGTGTALTWNTAQTGLLTPVYFFSGYNYYAPTPAVFALAPHPTQGAAFGDDANPAVLDEIAALGSLGFSTDGVRACPEQLPPGGACCFGHGVCQRLSINDCIMQGGVFQGFDTVCDPNPCPVEVWACCLRDTDCINLTEEECATYSDAHFVPGVLCQGDPCTAFWGACCTGDGYCFLLTEAWCLDNGGEFLGEGSSCDPSPCPPPVFGACCTSQGLCRTLTESECASQGNSYLGDGTSCDPNPCIAVPTGACCSGNGACVVTTEEACQIGGGSYIGDGTGCDPYPCPAGACCLSNGVCILQEELPCVDGGGAFFGGGSGCDPSPCPPAVCCFNDGSCQLLTAQECALLSGVFDPGQTECAPDACPPGGACCFGNQTCLVLTAEQCADLQGEWLGDGSDCVPSPCLELNGACCLDDGSCLEVTELECIAQGGLYHGPLTACLATDCFGQIGCGSPEPVRLDGSNGEMIASVSSRSALLGGAPDRAAGNCGTLLARADGTYENGGAVRTDAVQQPYYGAWAECYEGAYEVCQAVFDFTQTGTQAGQRMDVYLWEDLDGCPGQVLCLRANVDPGPVALWPSVSRHTIDLEGCCTPDRWWIGYWPNWPGENYGWFTTFDLNPASAGCPKICLAPGIFGPDGWQDVNVVWNNVHALGIAAGVRSCGSDLGACCLPDQTCTVTRADECAGEFLGVGTDCDPNPCIGPVPVEKMSWGKVKALFR